MLVMMMMFVCRRLQIRSLVSIWSKLITWAVCQTWPLNCRCVTVKPSTSTLRSVLKPAAPTGSTQAQSNSDMHSCSSIVSDPWGCLKLMCVFCAIGVTKCNSKNNASVCGSSSNWCSIGAEKQSTDEWIIYSLYTVKYLHEKYTSALNSGLISVQLHSCSLMKVKHGPLR